MVTTRKSDKGDKLQELPASGKIQPEPQQRPAKRAKTAKPLQEADEEIEKAIEATYAKEHEQLTQEDEEMATKQAEKAMGDEPEYKPSREEEAEDEAEERDAEEEMEASAVPAKEALQEKGEVEGAAGLEEEQTIDMQGKTVASPEEGEEEEPVEKEATEGTGVGQMAPDFTLKDQDDNDVSLKAFRGKIVALYFYNKDDSAVVSAGGKAFNALVPEMKKLGGELLFIGPDSVSSHKKFREKAKLKFPLLSDSKKEVAKKFHCIRGRNVARCTVLLDPKGIVLKTWKDIPESEVESNPVEALNWLKQHLPAMQQQQHMMTA